MPNLIDPEGYFNGDRFDMVADEARLFWPSFWCASNTYGRIELSYHKIKKEAFGRFMHPPSEDKFWELVGQYQRAYLLFIYESGDQVWGQWYTSVKYLPKYQLSVDKRSPAPPAEAFDKWKTEYSEIKKSKTVRKFIVSNTSASFEKLHEVPKSFPIGIGIGEVIGIVEGENQNHCPSDDGRGDSAQPKGLFALEPPPAKDPAELLLEKQRVWFKQFWAVYWRREAKKPSFDAFKKYILTDSRFHEIMAAVMEQTPKMLLREIESRPLASTWFNQSRWEDEHSPEKQSRGSPVPHIAAHELARQRVISGELNED